GRAQGRSFRSWAPLGERNDPPVALLLDARRRREPPSSPRTLGTLLRLPGCSLVAELAGVLRMFFVQPNGLLMQLTPAQHARPVFPLSSVGKTSRSIAVILARLGPWPHRSGCGGLPG